MNVANRLLLAAIVLAVTACAEEQPDPAAKARAEEADIAAVKAAQQPPPTPVTPGPIGYPDIEKYDLFGAGCSFAPGTSMAAVALAQPARAFMKIEGEIETFAPDAGSGELPLGVKGKYTGGAWSFLLDIASAEGKPSGSEGVNYPARLVLRNDRDQVVYEASGTAQCGS